MTEKPLLSAALVTAALALMATACGPWANTASPLLGHTGGTRWAEQCEDWDEWDKPAPPFRVHGNTYYVGTCGIGSILIAADTGHLLIDSGTRAGAEVVLSNISALGLHPVDIAVLLTSHEHFDHVGGMARLQEETGADVLTSPMAVPVLQTGTPGRDDPQFGGIEGMAPVIRVAANTPGNAYEGLLAAGNISSIATPGHTPGALSWYWQSCDETDDCKTIVYADSLSPVAADGYRFSDHPSHIAAYREGLARLAALECDILLTPHPSSSGMRDKVLAGDLSTGMNCADYAASVTARLDTRLQQEAQDAS